MLIDFELTSGELHDAALAARAATRPRPVEPNARIGLMLMADAESYTRMGRKFETARPSYRESADRQ